MARVVDLHRTRIVSVAREAEALAGTMLKVQQACEEVLKRGGLMAIQPQMAFAVGSIARMLKDQGVIEQLQADGVAAKRTVQERTET